MNIELLWPKFCGPRIPADDFIAGRHFMDILEPTIGNLIREVIPGAPKRQKVRVGRGIPAVMGRPNSSDQIAPWGYTAPGGFCHGEGRCRRFAAARQLVLPVTLL